MIQVECVYMFKQGCQLSHLDTLSPSFFPSKLNLPYHECMQVKVQKCA